jgi:hypothetical protein
MKIAAVDLGWLNATFALVARCYDLQTKETNTVSPDCLYYRGQALHLVNQIISTSPTAVPDATIGAVASLCNFDIISGNQASARAHMYGLAQMVKLRGGLENLGRIPAFLPKLVSWYDPPPLLMVFYE